MTTIFLDVDTQIDFLYPAGALYAKNAERIVPAVAQLNRHAAAHGIKIISTVDAHSENDPEFAQWPPHCVVGTAGQAKPAATRVGTPGAQVILEKQTTEVFRALSESGLLETMPADRYVVYGVVTDVCVKHAALGLARAGKEVLLVTDAVEALDAEAGQQVFRDLVAAGGKLTTVAEVCI